MARLRDGNLFLRRWDRTPERRLGSALALLICTSIGLLALSRFAEDKIAAANWRVAAWAAPALDAVTAPVDTLRAIGRAVSAHFGLVDELQSLKTENQKLASWEWRARQLEAKIADIEALAKVVPEQRLEFITSRVIAQSSGLFAKSVIIGAGSRQRVTTDFPVINADGLIGRVVDVATDTARVLLITDARAASRLSSARTPLPPSLPATARRRRASCLSPTARGSRSATPYRHPTQVDRFPPG